MHETASHVVILLHGIRDLAGWQESVSQILEKAVPELQCVKVRYGWFGPFSFISPIDRAGGPYRRFHKRYHDTRRDYPNAKISVVAHSFGTHLVGRLLSDNPSTRLHRIILCGGVLSRQFEWRNHRDQIDPNGKNVASILNECGSEDPWPNVAEAISARYGASGAYGFESPYRLEDRYYEGGHGLFFERDHVEEYWVPFLMDQPIGESNALHRKPKIPERLLLSVPGARAVFRLIVWIMWLVIFFWWLWLSGLALYGTSKTWGWPVQISTTFCNRDWAPIDFDVPADFNLDPPLNDPRGPDENQVNSTVPRYETQSVILEYVNDTNIDMWLLLFDYSQFYNKRQQPWWVNLSFPAGKSNTFKELNPGTGWVLLMAFHPDFEKPFWLAPVNLRNSEYTTLIVRCDESGLVPEVRQ